MFGTTLSVYIKGMKLLRATRKSLDPAVVSAEATAIAKKIIAAAQPCALFLFGSAAEGKATDQSDFDFLAVMQDVASLAKGRAELGLMRPLSSSPVDIVWVTKNDFIRNRAVGGVCLIAWEDGKQMHLAEGEQGLGEQ